MWNGPYSLLLFYITHTTSRGTVAAMNGTHHLQDMHGFQRSMHGWQTRQVVEHSSERSSYPKSGGQALLGNLKSFLSRAIHLLMKAQMQLLTLILKSCEMGNRVPSWWYLINFSSKLKKAYNIAHLCDTVTTLYAVVQYWKDRGNWWL